MDRNSIIGFLLIAAILIVFSIINSPKKDTRSIPSQTIQTDTQKQDTVINPVIQPLLAETEKKDSLPDLFQKHSSGEEKEITIETDLLVLKFSTKGGRISYSELKKYKTFEKKPLVLFENDESRFIYQFPYQNSIIKSSDLFFTTTATSKKINTDDSFEFSMKLALNDSQYIEHRYKVFGNNYMLGYSIVMIGFDQIIPKNTSYFDIIWESKARHQERKMSGKNARFNMNITTVYYQYDEYKPEKLNGNKDVSKDLSGKISWVGFKQEFFTQTLISKNNFIRGRVAVANDSSGNYSKFLSSFLSLEFKHEPVQKYDLSFYFGPCHYKTLRKYHMNLEDQIFLGKNIIRWVNIGLIIPVFNFLGKFMSNFGLIIFILTIIIKIILLPLTYKSYLSSARMRVLKPELDAIKEKVGKDPAKFQQEQLKLYRSAGVSPLGGCLPMLLQMPILIAMFRFFPSSIELRQESFLWATDLSTYDSIWNFPNGFRIPGYGDHVSLFTLLMTISTLIYTRMNMDMMGGETAKQMKVMQYLMPILFLGFFNNYSAGLSYYYFLANVLSFGQQYLFRLAIDEDKLRAQIDKNKLKRAAKPKSNWQKRLEDMQRQQTQARRK